MSIGNWEVRACGKDGSIVWVKASAHAVSGVDTDLVVLNCEDISEQRRGEQGWECFFALSLDLLYLAGFDGYFKRLNPAWEQLLGKCLWEEFPTPTTSTCYVEYHKAISEQVAIKYEEFYPLLEQWFAAHAYPTQDSLAVYFNDITERKQALEALQKAHDELEIRVEARTTELRSANEQLQSEIAERKRTEEAMRESEQMLQLVMNNIPQCIFWKNRNSVYLGCNRNFAQVAGVDSPENIVGKTDYELPWKQEEAIFFRKYDRQVIRTNTAEYHIIEPLLRADGEQAATDVPCRKLPAHRYRVGSEFADVAMVVADGESLRVDSKGGVRQTHVR